MHKFIYHIEKMEITIILWPHYWRMQVKLDMAHPVDAMRH